LKIDCAAVFNAPAQIDTAMDWKTWKCEAALTTSRRERILLIDMNLGMRSMPLHHLIGIRFGQMVLFFNQYG
jgi:hypothetical protein